MSHTSETRPSIEIRTWPGLAVCSALQMILFTDELPGIGEDFERMGRGINSDFANSILLFSLTNMPEALTDMALRSLVIHLEPEPFLNWVDNVNANTLATCANNAKHGDKTHRYEEIQSTEVPQSEDPASWVQSKATASQRIQARRLLANPSALKAMACKTLRTFWSPHFRPIYASHDAAVRAIANEPHPLLSRKDLPSLLDGFTGRSIDPAADWAIPHERILLVPLPFMGPYVVLMNATAPEPMAIFGFDAQRAVDLRTTSLATPDLTKLKALADETRLEILRFVSRSERFGGEIVTHLGISQPGVSKHLRLLAASGLLNVRQEGTSKYYSTCDGGLDAIADEIRQLKADSKDLRRGGSS
ncbi:metalloregulator ArsR/SmtB family transcription factor [Candidatus Bipolaricaulota bacterium]|nr:metalloregulator ArsR/SmtB family transcription factor [Candidatus Bipolaricaulota bacterium]